MSSGRGRYRRAVAMVGLSILQLLQSGKLWITLFGLGTKVHENKQKMMPRVKKPLKGRNVVRRESVV